MTEVWKSIQNFPSYEVSNCGRVRNKRTKKEKAYRTDNDGYKKVTLMSFKNGKSYHLKTVHRLVAESFINGPNPTLQINHINGQKDDNRVENLEWVTPSQNMLHAYKSNLRGPSGGRGPIRPVKVAETGIVYPNLAECAKAINSDPGNISKHLHGKIKSIKGYHLEYAD